MTRLSGESLDIREENISKLKELFPEVVADGKIDFDKLKQILGKYTDDSEERYRFVWNGKGEALRLSQTPSMGTLRPIKEESKDWETTENLYIEGDNLEVLKLLQKSYFGRVKMIYIDPPYNTGNDFVYPDNYKDNLKNYKKITGQVDENGRTTITNPEHSGRYHTDWLNMMYPRLRLGRNLLSDDGVIFISIDDNEVYNLRKICDEIFGEDNFLGNIVISVNKKMQKYRPTLGTEHEYTLVYARSKDYLVNYVTNQNYKFLEENFDEFKQLDKLPENRRDLRLYTEIQNIFKENPGLKNYKYKDEKGIFRGDNLNMTHGRGGNFNVYEDEDKKNKLNPPKHLWCRKDIFLKTGDFYEKNGDVYFKYKDKISYIDDKKHYSFLIYNDSIITQSKTYLDNKTVFNSILLGFQGSDDLRLENLLGGKIFEYPKILELIKTYIEFGANKNDIILDFFAGSSTTAHAVMDLNAEDGGNRKHIMVQLPEPTNEKSEAYKAGYKNIAEIGKERIRRAGEQIKEELEEKYKKATEEERKEMKNPDDLDIGFKVFKLDSSNIKEWNPGKYDDIQIAMEDSLNPYIEGRTEEDVVYEMMLKMGIDLTYPVEKYKVDDKTIYSIGFGSLMICLSEDINLSVAKKMIEIKEENNPEIWRTIFRDSGFNSDKDKTNVKETLKSVGLPEESFLTL